MRAGWYLAVALATAALISTPSAQGSREQSAPAAGPLRDVDVRDERPAAAPRLDRGRPQAGATARERRQLRLHRDTGAVRVFENPEFAAPPRPTPAALRALLVSHAAELGLVPADVATLVPVRDYTSRSTGVRHVAFVQVVDGHPVFDSAVTVHVRSDGTVARITSNAASIDARDFSADLSSTAARSQASSHGGGGAAGAPSLVWLPVSGTLKLAWHVAVAAAGGAPDVYDILLDAHTGELLVRRNRARWAEGSGRVLQGSASPDPRRPDPMPAGGDGTACPPPANYEVRSLTAPFRDSPAVLADSGRLEGNNARVFRGNTSTPAATGTADAAGWSFDFPFNSAGSAETFLFFAVNFAHDFFYDLGFDEAAGNFQNDNFGRGGTGGDPLRAVARAAGRNNATYLDAPDGSSPTISMFLWDGSGCWSGDVDGDGAADLDGDYDLDIVIHEYHHGVSLRLNTAFTGHEAGAIGEGGGDFFAYSINGDTTLAEYARPGGLRQVNDKGYADWTCFFGLICEVHANGEIWANVLWDVRERFRLDGVLGSESAAVNEVHQLYVDALTLSPPAPTMLDMRDALLSADDLRTAGQNSCRIWESFAARGMGSSATDTADNGFNQVEAGYDVPAGCVPPPAPPVVTVTTGTSVAYEQGPVHGTLTFTRDVVSPAPLSVNYSVAGTATPGADYAPLAGMATIPASSAAVTIAVVPIDDALVENNETVSVVLGAGNGYRVGTPSTATVTIVSDDVAPDLVVSALSAPRTAGAGATLEISDTAKNQGTGAAQASQTAYFLSQNALLDASDPQVGTRSVPELPSGSTHTATATITLPGSLQAGTYYLFAKADAPNAQFETNEQNNTRAAALAVGPDLTVTALTAPSTAGAGTSIVVTDTTTNTGAGAAPASVTRFFLSSDVFFTTTDTALQARSVPALAPGAGSAGSTPVTIPAGTPAGTYYLFARADADGDVAEPNENNNNRSAIVRIGPDLTVSALSVPSKAGAGSTIVIADTTRNAGAGAAAPSTTAFYLSSNLALDGSDVRLPGTRSVPALGPNQVSSGTTSVVLPDVAAGTWFVLAQADDGNAVGETQEANNLRFASVQVGPDLNIFGVSAPSTAAAGASITVAFTVRNSGEGAAGASLVKYYVSTNTLLDAGDLPLDAVWNVPPLAANATVSGSILVTLPGVSGKLYLLVVADGGGAVAEFNEANNVVARPITIASGISQE
jgi:subtilase family serine protease